MPEAFYMPAGEGRYVPTDATTSPWDKGSQHGGPPSALLATAVERVAGTPDLRLSRITVEFLRSIPRQEVLVEARVVRPGRRVAMTDATLSVDGEPVVLARAWHIGVGNRPPEAAILPGPEIPALPPEQPETNFAGLPDWGYGRAIEWRYTSGGFGEMGPAAVWTRVRLPLIAGESLTPYQRLLLVADSANGISGVLPAEEWLFIPPSLTVSLVRHPSTEWTFMSARTNLGPDGIGLTLATVADDDGFLGTVSQPLLVAPR